MHTSDFSYSLPEGLIAQTPVEPRDHSRLMCLHRHDGTIEHRHFHEVTGYLQAGDVLVFNDTRVIPARLMGRKADSGGKVEILLLRRRDTAVWEALVRPGRRVTTGTRIAIDNGGGAQVLAVVREQGENGIKVVTFSDEGPLASLGQVPLPPYIHTPLDDVERYQTVYARHPGSVAAPTAGLHFTPELLEHIEHRGVRPLFVTLHVGLDTFRPVSEDDPRQHHIYQEYGILSGDAARTIAEAKAEGRRVICVGTTTVRLLETIAGRRRRPAAEAFAGWVDMFILPGHRFRIVDGLITNFHLPRSTLLMLVCAFAGRDRVLAAYAEAVRQRYRFYSLGDAMLIL